MRNLESTYLEWLESWVCTDEEKQSYSLLLSKLHSVDFIWVLDKDSNRADDALSLREMFLDNFATEAMIENSTLACKMPSVLEVLVSLSKRLDDIIGYSSSSPARWFNYMLFSLGVIDMTNPNYNEGQVDNIMECFLRRKYTPEGLGGCCYFQCNQDLTKVDIWYQWMWYLNSLEEFKQ